MIDLACNIKTEITMYSLFTQSVATPIKNELTCRKTWFQQDLLPLGLALDDARQIRRESTTSFEAFELFGNIYLGGNKMREKIGKSILGSLIHVEVLNIGDVR